MGSNGFSGKIGEEKMFLYDLKDIYPDHMTYLRDESRLEGSSPGICFPKNESEISCYLKYFSSGNKTVTIQGARTGITAGAVPIKSTIMNLEKMNNIISINSDSITVQPGVILKDLQEALEVTDYFFPPDPTETTASIGGMISCNSSGARSYHYGSIRNYVQGLRLVLSNGEIISLNRDQYFAKGNNFSIKTENGNTIKGELPRYMTFDIKNTAGYYSNPEMDLIDLFIGSEGTLAVISEIQLKLMPKPSFVWGTFLLFSSDSVGFVDELKKKNINSNDAILVAVEYFDKNALELISEIEISPKYSSAIYLEFDSDSEDAIMDLLLEVMEITEKYDVSDEDILVASNKKNFDLFKDIRHSIPEKVNHMVDDIRKNYPEITKLGTDFAVPDKKLIDVMKLYKSDLSDNGSFYVIFGHIGNNHVHVNIIPKTPEEYSIGKELYLKWAKDIISYGGTVSAEHGIGKLKKELLEMMYRTKGIDEMKALKRYLDPSGILNNGNLF